MFSGRYKSLIVDGSGDGYLRTVCDYVHLNPSRARLLKPEERLRAYAWSSWPEYLQPPGQRPAWLRVDRLLGEYQIRQDNAAGRRQLETSLERRRAAEEGREYQAIRRGWFFGTDALKQELLAQVSERTGKCHYGEAVQASAEAKAERIVAGELKRRKWNETALAERRKGDKGKVAMALRLREESTVTLAWIAERLRMGTATHLAHLLDWHRWERKQHDTIN